MSGSPELVLIDTAVYTVDAARRWAGAVAVSDGRISAVGTTAEIRDLAGSDTEVIDLPGRLVLPGFQDAHVHPAFGGRTLLRVNLDAREDVPGYLDEIARYAAENPDEPWILGGGWAMPVFPGGTPRREDLDRIVPDRPVFLMNRDLHGAWLNGRALELGHITRDTSDPWDGRIGRDPVTGEPTGWLEEGAAYDFGAQVVPATTPAEWRDALLVAQRHLHGFGITAWQDAWVSPELLAAYRSLDDAGELTMHVSASLWWDRHRDASQTDELAERGRAATGGHLRATTVKIMTDGVVEDCSCSLLEPYDDPDGYPADHRGIAFVGGEALRDAVVALDAQGLQVHMHAIGDQAVRDSLDAVQAARAANGARDARHHVAHLQIVHPDDVPRFRPLGVVANLQPLWACMDPQMAELTLPRIGSRRIPWQYPFADLLRTGAVLAAGSDWPVSTPDPLREMEVAVRRVEPGEHGEPFLPEQRLTLPQAIATFTIGSAFVNHDDRGSGSIEVGKRADLAVVDRNVFDGDPDQLSDARVELTIASGGVVHGA